MTTGQMVTVDAAELDRLRRLEVAARALFEATQQAQGQGIEPIVWNTFVTVLAEQPITVLPEECRPAAVRRTPGPKPVVPGSDTEEALEIAAEIDDLIENGLPDRAWEEAEGFLRDVQKKSQEVAATIERKGFATDKQKSALENWKRGVERWQGLEG